MPLANFYKCLIDELNEEGDARKVFSSIDKQAFKHLRKTYESLNEQSSVLVDYSEQKTRQAYFVGYFPNYIQPIERTLRKLKDIGVTPYLNDSSHASACFIGGGPGPEALGWIGTLQELAPQTQVATAHILDKYAGAWKRQHDYVEGHLAQHYWPTGNFHIERHPFDLGLTDTRNSVRLPEASLYVMQNCLPDQSGDVSELVNRIFRLFTGMPQNSQFIIIDFNYSRTFAVLTDLAARIGRSRIGTVLLDVGFDTAEPVPVPSLVEECLFSQEDGLRPRGSVTFYRVAFKRIDRSETTVDVVWPVAPLPARETSLNQQLARHPGILETLHTQVAPADRVRISPYIEQALWASCFGEDRPPSRANLLLQNLPNQQTLDRMAEIWIRQNRELDSPLHELPTSDAAKSWLLGNVVKRIPRIQTILLSLLRSGQMPENASWVFTSDTRYIDAVALIDFMLAVADAIHFMGKPEPISAIRLVLPHAKEPSIGRIFFDRYLALTHSTYVVALPNWIEIVELEHLGNEGTLPNQVIITDLPASPEQRLEVETLIREQATDAIVLTPTGREAAKWRHSFLTSVRDLAPIGPCGSEFGGALPETCCECSIEQRIGFHSSGLVQAFLERVTALQSPDSNAPTSMSLSYVALHRQPRTTEHTPVPLDPRDGDLWTTPVSLRVLGTYPGDLNLEYPNRQRKSLKSPAHATADTDSQGRLDLALCPAPVDSRMLNLKRQAGKALPRVGFGQLINVGHVTVDAVSTANTISLRFTDSTTVDAAHEFHHNGRDFLSEYDDSTRVVVDRLAQRWFGFTSMKPFQHEILSQALTGKPILGIAATGGGKSECFILPALALPGITIVVSPLKSLMQDQLEQRLSARYGVHSLATFINGDVPLEEREIRLHRLERGHFKLIYLTPEQLERGYVLESLHRADRVIGIRYLALDEAHCISQWGHDFRPSYLNILARLRRYEIRPVPIALTATASPNVRADICKELGLRNLPLSEGGNVLLDSSNRPELNLVVRIEKSAADRSTSIQRDLRKLLDDNRTKRQAGNAPGAAIVFMPHTGSSHRKVGPPSTEQIESAKAPAKSTSDQTGMLSAGVEEFASYLQTGLETEVSIYHGKLDDDEPTEDDPLDNKQVNSESASTVRKIAGRDRRTEQSRFISGKTEIMIATKGFGMGIDKPNIRLVIHRTAPGNLEAYVQEAGRAGRDGQRANVILYYARGPRNRPVGVNNSGTIQSDEEIQEFFLSERYIRREDVAVMRRFLQTLRPHLNGYLHFTSTQAITFFNNAGFTWPTFDLRQPRGKWTGEHLRFWESGEAYRAKSAYIKRILDVLYRIRPDMHGEINVPFLESAQEISTTLRIRRIDVDAIWTSTHYFSNVLHHCVGTRTSLAELFRTGIEISLADLSRNLSLPISDVKALLSDMRTAETEVRNSRSEGRLLQYSVSTPRNPSKPSEWRTYAGVTRRVLKNEAEAKARLAGRAHPTDDDWFPEQTLSRPLAWEVQVGAGYSNDAEFEQYLDAFMSIHDSRQANDWAAYHRLLHDYIGVTEQKDSEPDITAQRYCLREVMLGYLKTGEVVTGDNCRSCSVCVPDEDFDQFTDDQRKQVVVRLDANLLETLDVIDMECAVSAPSQERIDTLFDHVRGDVAAGRSTDIYVMAWSARVAQETPNHIGALWLRVQGSLDIGFSIASQELQENVCVLAEKLSTAPELERIYSLIHRITDQHEHRNRFWALLKSKVTIKLRRDELSFHELDWLIEGDENDDIQYEAATQLFALTTSDGIFPDAGRNAAAGWKAGKLANEWPLIRRYFSPIAATMSWADVIRAVEGLSERNAAALAFGWLTLQPDQEGQLATVHATELRPWRHVPTEELVAYIGTLDRRVFLHDTSLLREVVEESGPGSSPSSMSHIFADWFAEPSEQDSGSISTLAAVDDACQLATAEPAFWASMPAPLLLGVCHSRTLEEMANESPDSARVFSTVVLSSTNEPGDTPVKWFWGPPLQDGISLTDLAAGIMFRANLVPSSTDYLDHSRFKTTLASISRFDDLDAARFLSSFAEQLGLSSLAAELRLCILLSGDDSLVASEIEGVIFSILQGNQPLTLQNHYLSDPRLMKAALQFAESDPMTFLPRVLAIDPSVQATLDETLVQRFAQQLKEAASTSAPDANAISAYFNGRGASTLRVVRTRAVWWLNEGADIERMLATRLSEQVAALQHLYAQQLITASQFDDLMIGVLNSMAGSMQGREWADLKEYAAERQLTRLSRVARLITFVQELGTRVKFRDSLNAGPMLHAIYDASLKGRDPERSSYTVFLLEAIQTLVHFSDNYLTPGNIRLQALCDAGWFEEARSLAEKYPDLRMSSSHLDADEFVEMKEKRFNNSAASKADVELMRRIVRRLI